MEGYLLAMFHLNLEKIKGRTEITALLFLDIHFLNETQKKENAGGLTEIRTTSSTKQHPNLPGTFRVRHAGQNLSLIVDKRERWMDFFLLHTAPEGSDISARLQPFNNKDSHFGLQTSGGGREGGLGTQRAAAPGGQLALLRSLTCFPRASTERGQVLPRVPVGLGGPGGAGGLRWR